MSNSEKILIITGQPANGKTTIGKLLCDRLGFHYIEGDSFITTPGKIRLNNGTWNDTDRRIYLSRMAASAVEAGQENPLVVVVDCLTTRWMREFLIQQICILNQQLAVGFILLERQLDKAELSRIAVERSAQGHALDLDALSRFRQAFEPWDPKIPHVTLQNPGDGNMDKLTHLTTQAISELWNQ